MSCSAKHDGNIGFQLRCILSYDGNVQHTAINYTLLILNLLVVAVPLFFQQQGRNEEKRKRRLYAVLSFIFVVFFQITLCLAVQCVGISIIWCAMAGWIAMDNNIFSSVIPLRNPSTTTTNTDTVYWGGSYHPTVILCIDGMAILYYAIVEEPITTVAHILAIIVLGIPLHSITERLSRVQSEHTANSPNNNSIQSALLATMASK